MPDSSSASAPKPKKRVDRAALTSPFMRIPRMKVEAARSLLDAGVSAVYELEGRSPEALFNELKKRREDLPTEHLAYFRMAVYFAETPEPDLRLLHPTAWQG